MAPTLVPALNSPVATRAHRPEPQAHGLHAGRVVGGFGQAEDEAADHEAGRRGGQAMGAGGQAPQQHGAEEGALDADLVDQSRPCSRKPMA
jgi:hypothetical protein